MRTTDEILKRIAELDATDIFGFTRSDLILSLPFEAAKPFLKADAAEEDWDYQSPDEENIVSVIKTYMPFAWEKANNCRGLSAARSLDHMKAWLWLLGEDEAAGSLGDYTHYGKPELRAICEHYGVDWKELDDGEWKNSEYGDYVSADEVPEVVIQWNDR